MSMGIDTEGKYILGASYEDFKEKYKGDKDIDELLDDGELEYASPWYDSDRNNWFVGCDVGYVNTDVNTAIEGILQEAEEFKKEFGFEPKLYCSAHVY